MSLKSVLKNPLDCLGIDDTRNSASTSCPSRSGLEFGADPFSFAGGVRETLPTWNNYGMDPYLNHVMYINWLGLILFLN